MQLAPKTPRCACSRQGGEVGLTVNEGGSLDGCGRAGLPLSVSMGGPGLRACGIQSAGRRVEKLRPQTSVDVSDHRTGQALTHRPLLPAHQHQQKRESSPPGMFCFIYE